MVSHTYRKLVFYTTAHISRKKCLKCYIATPVGPGVNKKKGIDSPWWDFWLVLVVDTGQKKSVQEEETFFFLFLLLFSFLFLFFRTLLNCIFELLVFLFLLTSPSPSF